MNKKIKNLAALISASLAHNVAAAIHQPVVGDLYEEDNTISVSLLNETISQQLAAHRSHSSHGSHRSHRSSSGGGYRAPATPSPTPKSPAPSEPIKRQADPLGQDPRPKSSYPSVQSQSLAEKLKNKEMRKNIIMRMQLTLQFEGYYDGPIDGAMGPKTRSSVLAYKKSKNIPGDKVLDAPTLNALGIKGY